MIQSVASSQRLHLHARVIAVPLARVRLAGLGMVVTKHVPYGTTVMGVPARAIEQQKRLLRRLSDLAAAG